MPRPQTPDPRSLLLIGMKASGKTTVGRLLAERLEIPFVDVDAELERVYAAEQGEPLSFREIFRRHGRDYFRALEQKTLRRLVRDLPPSCVLATGGGLPLAEANRPLLQALGTIIYLDVAEEVLLARLTAAGEIPPFFPYPDDPARSLRELLAARRPIYTALADHTLTLRHETPEEITNMLMREQLTADS